MESTPDSAPLYGPMTIGSWLSAEKGDASGLWLQSFAGNLLFPKSFVWGQYASFGRADDKVARRYFAAGGHDVKSNLGDAATAGRPRPTRTSTATCVRRASRR